MEAVAMRLAELTARQARTTRWCLLLVLAVVMTVVLGFVLTVVAGAVANYPGVAGAFALLGGSACLLLPLEGIALIVVYLHGRGLGAQTAWLRRVAAIMQRHGCDETTALRILRREVWEGMREAMLLDARGFPVGKDQKRFKGAVREVWKYDQIGQGRFATRIIVDQGVVIGWDVKRT